MSKRVDDVIQDIREIKHVMHANTMQLTAYNIQLEEHIRATRNLESRVAPIEDHVKFLRTLGRLVAWIVATSGAFAGLIKLFF